jgi:uncharacterized membrane protein
MWALAIGTVAWFVSPSQFSTVTRILIAGDAGGLSLLAIVFWIIVRSNVRETRRRAAAHDPGRTAVWLVVLGISGFSLFAATFVLRQAKSLPHGEDQVLLVLSVTTAMVSWLLTHAAFTLRYAHLFYRGGTNEEGGIEFPGGAKPDDLDFAYFAFTIGMCFQVSDASISNRLIRRTALVHGVLSFAYNTGILALVLNMIMSQLG